MNQEASLLSKLWNFEFRTITKAHQRLVLVSVVVGGFTYVILEVLFGFNNSAQGFTLSELLNPTNTDFIQNQGWKKFFPQIWIAVALSVVVFRLSVIYHSYVRSKQILGEAAFTRYITTYFTSFAFALALGLAIMYALFGLTKLLGFGSTETVNVFSALIIIIQTLADSHIPTVINVQSYWLALILSVFLAALPGYFVHWLTHKYRFFWYVFHRCHHCPEFLHPLGAPPAFAFDFALVLPSGLVAIAASKLIYTEPLVMELALWFTLTYAFEIFNHSIVHYNFAYSNIFVRGMSIISGDRGVYHLVHHSAKPQDQTINLGGGPFMVWDRLFGTYRVPYKEAPPLGLTNMPKIHHNPLRIILSGISQLLFELKENKNWMTRLKIIFGPIHYQPPITKEYLILDY